VHRFAHPHHTIRSAQIGAEEGAALYYVSSVVLRISNDHFLL
jgi:hypothetical protein